VKSSITLLLLCSLSANQAFAWGRYEGGWRPERRDPVVVHKVYVEHRHGGCVGCGAGVAAIAGLVTGAIIGAAVAGSSSPPPEVIETPPPVVIQAPPPVVYAGPPIGSEVAMLPPGCGNANVNGVTYYTCSGIWYQPFFGGNGVYYTVVPQPY
jgi:hypothetical protein